MEATTEAARARTGRTAWLRAAGAILATAAVGCSTSLKPPDLAALYNRSAQYHGPERNPIVVIPGILGSRLKDLETRSTVWGAFGGDFADPGTTEGARTMALPMREGVDLRALRDGVVPDGVLDRIKVRLLGLPLELKAYFQILRTLGAGGYHDESLGVLGEVDYGSDHYTCFQFPYDWRRDNVENAARLHEFLLEKRAYVRAETMRRSGVDRDVKFDVVAHSMGGLLLRYYLMYGKEDLPADGTLPEPTWAGKDLVDRAILVGTPSSGAVDALAQLVRGRSFGFFMPSYSPAVVGTFPALYELLPRGRHGALVESAAPGAKSVDPLDPAVWEREKWGLAAPDQDEVLRWLLPDETRPEARRRIALDHQRKSLERARRFHAALDRPAPAPAGLGLYLVAGDAEPTNAVAAVRGPSGSFEVLRKGPGDGTVLRSSALADEREGGEWTPWLRSPVPWTHVTFLFTDHIGLTRDPAFADNVLHLLLEAPPAGLIDP